MTDCLIVSVWTQLITRNLVNGRGGGGRARDMQKHVRDPVSFVCLWRQREGPRAKAFMQLLVSEQTQGSSILASSEERQHRDLSIEIHWDLPQTWSCEEQIIYLYCLQPPASWWLIEGATGNEYPFFRCALQLSKTLWYFLSLSLFFFSSSLEKYHLRGPLVLFPNRWSRAVYWQYFQN